VAPEDYRPALSVTQLNRATGHRVTEGPNALLHSQSMTKLALGAPDYHYDAVQHDTIWFPFNYFPFIIENQTALLGEAFVGVSDFDLMSIDELWSLHEKLATTLAARLNSEKALLEVRLKQLNQQLPSEHQAKPSVLNGERRPYPAVVPKYRNPNDASQTWSGRGKRPRWLVALLKTGKQIEDFRISTKTIPRGLNVAALGKREVS
jgi:DNA-binding protein H-NS